MGRYPGPDGASARKRNRPMQAAGRSPTPVTSRGRGDRRAGRTHDLIGYFIGFSIVASILWFIFVDCAP